MSKPVPAGPAVTDAVRKIADLKRDPKNARRHTEAQIAQIVRSIEEFGFVNKIVIRPDGQLIGGDATLSALQRLSRTEAECREVAGLTEAQYRQLALALNKIPANSSWDDDMLAEVLGDLREEGEDLALAGFSTGEVDKLLKEPDALE